MSSSSSQCFLQSGSKRQKLSHPSCDAGNDVDDDPTPPGVVFLRPASSLGANAVTGFAVPSATATTDQVPPNKAVAKTTKTAKDFQETKQMTSWVCTHCQTINSNDNDDNSKCIYCAKYRKTMHSEGWGDAFRQYHTTNGWRCDYCAVYNGEANLECAACKISRIPHAANEAETDNSSTTPSMTSTASETPTPEVSPKVPSSSPASFEKPVAPKKDNESEQKGEDNDDPNNQ